MQSLCLRTPLATIHCNTGAIVLSLSSQSRFVFPSETGPVGDRNRRRPQRRTGPPCQVGSGWAYPLRQCLVLSHGDLPSRERFGRCDRAVVVVGCQLGHRTGPLVCGGLGSSVGTFTTGCWFVNHPGLEHRKHYEQAVFLCILGHTESQVIVMKTSLCPQNGRERTAALA